MDMLKILEKKRLKQELSNEEIAFWISGYVKGEIPDYQVSALLMAICLNGMTKKETVALTKCMKESGDVLDLSFLPGVTADKHSTGGVGDKTTLVLIPMLAACGMTMAKMSGRGLGFTGGTIDKLESIPGFTTGLSREDFIRQVEEIGLCVIGQTADLVPADKKLYALRDVTDTVESKALIASSIMSKKLAAGAEIIVLDVKYGNGAFMKTRQDAEELAGMMVDLAHADGKKASAVISDMNQPLGYAIGNALEVAEAIDTLHGKGPQDLVDLCLEMGSSVLMMAQKAAGEEEARGLLRDALASGRAADKLSAMIRAQKGDDRVVQNPDLLRNARVVETLISPVSGQVCGFDVQEIGRSVMRLGGGRMTLTDVIDPSVGVILKKKTGDTVTKGEALAVICAKNKEEADREKEELIRAIHIHE